MSVTTAALMALRSILANRLRSGLTMLGLVIGIGSVILLVAAGHATTVAVERQLEALGTNVISIYPGGDFDEPVGDSMPILTDRDVTTIESVGRAAGVDHVFPMLQPQVRMGTGQRSLQIGDFTGAPPGYLAMRNIRYSAGRGYTEQDERSRARVVVLGAVAAQRLFGRTPPVGRPVAANGVRFRVVGVMRPRGGDRNADNAALAPYTTTRDNLAGPSAPLSGITVQATSRAAVTTAQGPIQSALASARRSSGNDVSIFDEASLLGTTNTITSVLRIVLAGVAGTSLFVGGMGVMNIMLVTVVERTREIGIRKAIGARHAQIVSQFLIEAVVLCLMGGVAGVVVGLVVAGIGGAVSGYPATVGPGAIVLALGVAVTIGLAFGFYPANRAALLRPIDALRHE